MSIEEREKEIESEFELFGNNWEAKYEYIIEMGKSLPKLDETEKTEERLIKGCQNKLWLKSELKQGKVIYKADSDGIISKGIAALMIRVLSDASATEILGAPLHFLERIGLKEHLAMTRANGLAGLIKQMKMDALAYSVK